jgi:hypothetical protein
MVILVLGVLCGKYGEDAALCNRYISTDYTTLLYNYNICNMKIPPRVYETYIQPPWPRRTNLMVRNLFEFLKILISMYNITVTQNIFVHRLQRVLKWKFYETGASVKFEKRVTTVTSVFLTNSKWNFLNSVTANDKCGHLQQTGFSHTVMLPRQTIYTFLCFVDRKSRGLCVMKPTWCSIYVQFTELLYLYTFRACQ